MTTATLASAGAVAPMADRTLAWVEGAAAFLLAALAYYALQGELPYHDAQRFTDQVVDDRLVWDVAHILLQPMAVVLHRWTDADPVSVLKGMSSISTAAAVGLFHMLLLRLDLPRWQAVLGTLLLAGCCSVLTLAPSAHPKLVAFPFVNGALLCWCMAERQLSCGEEPVNALLLTGGALLAVAAGFLASALAAAPFAALAILFATRRGGASWSLALGQATLMAGACGLVFIAIVGVSFVLLSGEPLSMAALAGSVGNKADLRPAPIPLPVHMARVVFGTANNLVALPNLGATAQAAMRGQIPTLVPYAGLLPILGLFLLAGLLIGIIYLRTGWAMLRNRVLLMPVAFLGGAQAWTIWYGLNDPEHWFQLTAPTILLFLLLMPPTMVRWGLPTWAVIATTANLALLAVPVATYPLTRHEAELRAMVGPQDLLLFFASYPGQPYVGFFNLPTLRTLRVDLQLREPGITADGVLRGADQEIARTLQAGGRVFVADMLNPLDWEAPWMALLAKGVTKQRLLQTLLSSRAANPLPDLGGIKMWQLRQAAPG